MQESTAEKFVSASNIYAPPWGVGANVCCKAHACFARDGKRTLTDFNGHKRTLAAQIAPPLSRLTCVSAAMHLSTAGRTFVEKHDLRSAVVEDLLQRVPEIMPFYTAQQVLHVGICVFMMPETLVFQLIYCFFHWIILACNTVCSDHRPSPIAAVHTMYKQWFRGFFHYLQNFLQIIFGQIACCKWYFVEFYRQISSFIGIAVVFAQIYHTLYAVNIHKDPHLLLIGLT